MLAGKMCIHIHTYMLYLLVMTDTVAQPEEAHST